LITDKLIYNYFLTYIWQKGTSVPLARSLPAHTPLQCVASPNENSWNTNYVVLQSII